MKRKVLLVLSLLGAALTLSPAQVTAKAQPGFSQNEQAGWICWRTPQGRHCEIVT